MSFMNPIALALSALAGLIVLMYLLKLKRRREIFSSTLLWVKSMEDLTANAPFQKLRQNLLMYLQIFFLLLLALSVARPTMWLNRRSGASRIVLIDNSASMNATDVSPSRLEAAKSAAHEIVDNMKSGDQMMIVTFGGQARVIQAFSTERGLLNSTIRSIEPTDAEARIQDALLIVEGVRKVDKTAVLTIISDGGIGHLGNLVGKDDVVEFHQIGTSDDNRGIVAFDVRESFEQKGEAQVFTEVENFGSNPSLVRVKCLIDGEVAQVKEATIDPKAKQGFAFTGLEGDKKLVRVELDGKDLLASDDAAQGIVNLNSTINLLLVSNGNFFLEKMLSLTPGAQITKVSPNEYDPKSVADLTVFDQFAPKELGSGNYMFLNAMPPVEGFKREEAPLKAQLAVDWNRLHPITRFLTLDELVAGEAINMGHPDWVVPLVESPEAPLVLAGDRQGLKIVCVTFDLYSTDWPLQVSFPIFFSNAIQWLVAAGSNNLSVGYHCGDTVTFQARADNSVPLVITGPDGKSWKLDVNDSRTTYFNQTFRAGLYQAKQGDQDLGQFAVNLLSLNESDIAPKSEIASGEQKIVASSLSRENREVWSWFVLAGLCLLAFEWHWYCRRSWL